MATQGRKIRFSMGPLTLFLTDSTTSAEFYLGLFRKSIQALGFTVVLFKFLMQSVVQLEQ